MSKNEMIYGKGTLLPGVTAIEQIEGYRIRLRFSNGEVRIFDAADIIGLKPYDAIATVFDQVRADYGTIVWPGGIDVSPETVYLNSYPAE